MVAARLEIGQKHAELAQLLAGGLALHLQPLVVLSQVGHLGEQDDLILLLL